MLFLFQTILKSALNLYTILKLFDSRQNDLLEYTLRCYNINQEYNFKKPFRNIILKSCMLDTLKNIILKSRFAIQ